MLAPTISLWLLIQQKASFIGLARHNLVRFNIYFFLILVADIERVLTQSVLATYVLLVGFFLVSMNFGHAAAVVRYCPEAKKWSESMKIIFKRSKLFPMYLLLLGAWLVVTLSFAPVVSSFTVFGGASEFVPSFPLWYSAFTIATGVPVTLYPCLLMVSSLRRVQVSYTRNSLVLMLACWFCFPTIGLLVFSLLTPIISLSFQISLIMSTAVYCLLAISIRSVPGTTRFLKSNLVPQSLIRMGKRYLVLHDAGPRTIAFLSSAFRSAIDSGSRVFIGSPASWLVDGLHRSDARFNDLEENGKLVTVSSSEDQESAGKEGLSDKLGWNKVGTVSVREFAQEDLQRSFTSSMERSKAKELKAEVYLLESNKAPRLQVAEFLRKNNDVEVVNLSEASDPFSSLVNMNHQKLEGSKILMEYSSNANVEDLVGKLFDEGIANAEMCSLFTSKSSKLYRALKGKRMVRVVAASSLVSAPDELPDGEIQIPDKELGLVTSLVTEFYENNRSLAFCLVFDSIGDLIRGERWEQVYSGVKQLIELVAQPTVTAMFLVNTETVEPRFLGAMRGLFSVQMSLGETAQSLRVAKTEP